MAVLNAKQIGRTHAVVLHLPRLPDVALKQASESLAVPSKSTQRTLGLKQ